mgnify:CR=1 FL=1
MINNNISEDKKGLILKYDFSKRKLLIKELNTLFRENNLPLFIASITEDGELLSEATLPEEVDINNVETAIIFNHFLRDCTDFNLYTSE